MLASAAGLLLAGCGGRGGDGGSQIQADLPMAPDFSSRRTRVRKSSADRNCA